MRHKPGQIRIESRSPEETFSLGERIGRHLRGELVIGLVGPLGAGKTRFVKGLASGNALDDVRVVTSPTFTLVNEYPGRVRLIHIDVYRLNSPAECTALGFDEMLQKNACIVVEWADRVASILPPDRLWIELMPTGETSRSISVAGLGKCAALSAELTSTLSR